mmetsp:Transcript_32531/g.69270  ORF Transcript_32531/g.69270 Transcript_32531/m.69270 type:complete len:306 (+) Transcript_32531:991-1908(+)
MPREQVRGERALRELGLAGRDRGRTRGGLPRGGPVPAPAVPQRGRHHEEGAVGRERQPSEERIERQLVREHVVSLGGGGAVRCRRRRPGRIPLVVLGIVIARCIGRGRFGIEKLHRFDLVLQREGGIGQQLRQDPGLEDGPPFLLLVGDLRGRSVDGILRQLSLDRVLFHVLSRVNLDHPITPHAREVHALRIVRHPLDVVRVILGRAVDVAPLRPARASGRGASIGQLFPYRQGVIQRAGGEPPRVRAPRHVHDVVRLVEEDLHGRVRLLFDGGPEGGTSSGAVASRRRGPHHDGAPVPGGHEV